MNRKQDEVHYRIEPLGEKHNRADFSCGVEALDRYLQKQASQDIAKRVAAAFVITPDGEMIAGFYGVVASRPANDYNGHSDYLGDQDG